MVAFLLVLGFNACSNGGGGGGPAGGPGVPSTGTGDNGGKYTNPKTGEDYKVGETGPGGGKIFYDSVEETGDYFTMTDNNDEVRYLEASLDYSQNKPFASTEYLNTSIDGTEKKIGSGRKNTVLILAKDPDAPVAKFCVDYRGGDLDDWFLPSFDELAKFVKTAVNAIEGGSDDFKLVALATYSSSQSQFNDKVLGFSIMNGPSYFYNVGGTYYESDVGKTGPYFFRPIRAF